VLSATYAALLTLSLAGQLLIDRRWRLFFWRDRTRAVGTMLIGLVFFIAWDLAGIGLGVFFKGGSPFTLGIDLAPEFPVEELLFLGLLIYVTMNLHGWFTHRRRAQQTTGVEP
jgi:lycopene cyclase domain-containing protein